MDADDGIPNKTYFKIGEVARLTGLEPHVLRFWESEFRHICPEKSRSGQRLYRRIHIERILEIKDLLYQQKFTIAGARRRLLHRHEPDAAEAAIQQTKRKTAEKLQATEESYHDVLRDVRRQLVDIRRLARLG